MVQGLAHNKCSQRESIHHPFWNEVEMEKRRPHGSPVHNPQFHFLPDCLPWGSLCSVLFRMFSRTGWPEAGDTAARCTQAHPRKTMPKCPTPSPRRLTPPPPRPRHNPSTRDPGPHSSKDPDQEAPGSFQGCWTLQDLCSKREENEGGRDDRKEPELVQLAAAAAARSISSLGPPGSP